MHGICTSEGIEDIYLAKPLLMFKLLGYSQAIMEEEIAEISSCGEGSGRRLISYSVVQDVELCV